MIRAILLEVERLHSHLPGTSVLACHFTGFDSGFMQFFRVRRDLDEDGRDRLPARVRPRSEPDRRDPPRPAEEDMIQTRQLARAVHRDECRSWWICCSSTPNMEQRTVGIGRLDPEIARDFSNVGPMVRASGCARDTRADHPFVGYGLLPMGVHSEQGCDVYIYASRLRINEGLHRAEYD